MNDSSFAPARGNHLQRSLCMLDYDRMRECRFIEFAPKSVDAAHPVHEVVQTLIQAGAPVNACDARGRTALQLAVKACIDSYWKYRRKPDSVAALLAAGAQRDGIDLPTGYAEIDSLLSAAQSS